MSGSGVLSEQQVLAIGRGLLSELARRHDAGQVGGVVAPATVLVDPDGSVRLVDGPVDPAYAAPEVLAGQPPTAASDLYGAGALLAHLFRGTSTVPPSVAGLDAGAAWLLGPVLGPDPATRPQSAAAMVGAIDQLAEQRHGPEWRLAGGLLGGVAVAGGVPVLLLATGGSAAASAAGAGAAGAAGAAGLAGAAGAVGATGAAGGVAGVVGGVGGVGAAGGAGAAVAGAGAAGAGVAGAAGGVAGGAGGAAGAAGAGAAGASGAAGSGALAGLAAPTAQVAAGSTGGLAAPGGATAGGHAVVSAGGAQAGGQGAAHGAAHAGVGGVSKGLAVKVGAAVAAGGVGVAGAAAAVIVLTGAETVDVKVPATADIYLVGADDELTAQLSDPGTKPIKIDVDGASTIRFTSVKGDVAACDGCAPGSPDGSGEVFASTAVTGFNGIPGVTHADRTLFVVGVFVGDDQPAFPADAVEDLTEESDAESQSPYLGEPIFIGDGETDDGTLQEIEVPSDATALYIGFADGYGFVGAPGAYGDNSGTVSVEVEID